MRRLQARVLANAAEAIRIITALVYPILPESAAKVWQQLGLGEIEDAAKQAFLTDLAWGGLKAGTQFSDPAPLFPRAEKDAIERMQNLEDENNKQRRGSRGGQRARGRRGSGPHAGRRRPPRWLRTTATDRQTNQENESADANHRASRMTPNSRWTRPRCIPCPTNSPARRLRPRRRAAPAGAPLNPEEKKTENPPDAPPAARAHHH